MGEHSVPHGEKSTLGAANSSPGTPGYQGKHRAAETTRMDRQGTVSNKPSRLRTGGWLKKKDK